MTVHSARAGRELAAAAAARSRSTTTASQLQVHVLELTHGDLLPPCPGHGHPLDTGVVDGVACWVCPKDPAHHAEPILPAG